MRKDTFWNMLAGMLNAMESIIIMSLVTRLNGVEYAGVMSLAFAVANLFLMIGKGGIYNYQLVHQNEAFGFNTFRTYRFFTTSMMLISGVIYVTYLYFVNQLALDNICIILIVVLWYAVESIEDGYIAACHNQGQLFLGKQFFVLRWALIISVLGITDILTTNVFISVLISLIAGFVCFLIFAHRFNNSDKSRTSYPEIKTLFINCFPLMFACFANYYYQCIPKYVMVRYLSNTNQAIYGYISMPLFAVGLLSTFIYVPKMNYFISLWKNNNHATIKKELHKQLLSILIITITGCMMAYLIGTQIMSFVFGIDLSIFKWHLVLIGISSGLLSVTGFISSWLVIMNKQKLSAIIYLLCTLSGTLIAHLLITYYGLSGCFYSCLVNMLISCIVFMSVFMSVFTVGLRNY